MLEWRDPDYFPLSTEDGWRITSGSKGKPRSGWALIERAMASNHPFGSKLVANKAGSRFTPILNHPDIQQRALENLQLRVRLTISITFVALISGIILLFWRSDRFSLNVVLSIGCLFSFFLLDYILVIKDAKRMAERAIFSARLHDTCHPQIAVCVGLMIVAGLLQWTGQQWSGGFEPLVKKIGAYYPEISLSQAWRIFTGPLIHADEIHWLANLGMLMLAGALAGAISRRISVIVFFLGSAVSVLAALSVARFTHHDALVGISGGIFALFGFVSMASLRFQRHFPSMFYSTVIGFSALSFVLAWISSRQNSSIAHLAGFLFGSICCVLFLRLPQPETTK